MLWVKQALVFAPSVQGGFMNSHAKMPAGLVRGDRLRVFFSTRSRVGVSVPAFIMLPSTIGAWRPGRSLSAPR